MIGGVTRRMLPHLSRVPHLHVIIYKQALNKYFKFILLFIPMQHANHALKDW